MIGAGAALAIVVTNVENRLLYEAVVLDVIDTSKDVGGDILNFHIATDQVAQVFARCRVNAIVTDARIDVCAELVG